MRRAGAQRKEEPKSTGPLFGALAGIEYAE
jgi:hypothetical protein